VVLALQVVRSLPFVSAGPGRPVVAIIHRWLRDCQVQAARRAGCMMWKSIGCCANSTL